MPNLKQKNIKPARTVPYSEGILAFNDTGSELPQNSLVRVNSGSLQGGGLRIAPAGAANDAVGGKVPVFVTKHRIPTGKWGVILPWSIVSNINTLGVTAEGDAVYLQDVVGTFGAGKGTVHRAVGVCIVKHATTGVVWLCPGQFSYGTD